MSKWQKVFLIFCIGNMEIFGVYTLAAFLAGAFEGKRFSLIVAFLLYWSATGISFVFQSKRIYRIVWLLAQGAGLALGGALSVYVFYQRGDAFFGNWLLDLVASFQTSSEILIFTAALLLTAVFYVMGALFTKKQINYKKVLSKMEKALILLFFVAFLASVIGTYTKTLGLYILLFFFWGILSVALSKNQSWGSAMKKGGGATKLIAAFTIGVCALIVAILAFTIDYLKLAANQGYHILKAAADPLAPYLIRFIRFILGFMSGGHLAEQSSSSGTAGSGSGDMGALEGNGSPVMDRIFLALIFCVMAAVLIFLFYYLFLWLFTKKGKDNGPFEPKKFFRNILAAFIIWVAGVYQWIKQLFSPPKKNQSKVWQIYRKMLKWGAFKGIVYQKNETPFEYANRLCERYPNLQEAFFQISKTLCMEVYGGKTLNDSQITRLKSAWKQIAVSRVKIRLKNCG